MISEEQEVLSQSTSRKSSISSTTGSSFEKFERMDSTEESEVPEDDNEQDMENENKNDCSTTYNNIIDNDVDLSNIPIKLEQEQFYTYEDKVTAIRRLIMFSSAMFILPLLIMFTMYHYVFIDHYNLPTDKAMLYAGGCGIATVFLIVSLFVYVAYKDEVEAERRLKKQS